MAALSRGMDIETLERTLQVRRRARADGQAERPGLGASETAPTERDIGAAIAAEAAKLDALEADAVAALDRALAARPPTGPAQGAAVASTAELSLRLEEARIGPDVKAARQRADQAQADLRAFRDRHGLEQNPAYPESRILALGLLAAAAVFEAVFSATLFVHDADGGYAEAAAVAMGLGGSNVLLGVLAGYVGLRYWRAKAPALKAMGGAALVAFAGLAVGLNYYAARYRESLASDAEVFRPLQNLKTTQLFGLVTPEAVVLLMIGVGVWMFAATKGYAGLDDPYPDYGKLDRLRVKAQTAFEHLREDAVEALSGPIEAAADAIDATQRESQAHLARARAAYDAAGAQLAALGAARRTLAALETELLGLYRRENCAARQTPAPAHWAQPPASSLSAPRADPLAGPGASLAALEAQAAQLHADAAAARKALQGLHADSQARLFGAAA
jgi:hypothetical protein